MKVYDLRNTIYQLFFLNFQECRLYRHLQTPSYCLICTEPSFVRKFFLPILADDFSQGEIGLPMKPKNPFDIMYHAHYLHMYK